MKKNERKNTKLHFVKVLTTLELCNLVGLKLFTWERKEKKKERLYLMEVTFFLFQWEILERNMFVQLLEPNISIFCKKKKFLIVYYLHYNGVWPV